MLPTPVFWPGESRGLYAHGVAKSRTRLSDLFFLSSGGSVVKNLSEMEETQETGF